MSELRDINLVISQSEKELQELYQQRANLFISYYPKNLGYLEIEEKISRTKRFLKHLHQLKLAYEESPKNGTRSNS